MPRAGTTLVLLSLDERESLERLLPRIPLEPFEEVMAIDGGSTDGTLDVYRRSGIPWTLQTERGRGRAFVLAQRLVETTQVVFFSTDGNEDPSDLPRIVEGLAAGYDMVIAGRFVLAGSRVDTSDDPWGLRKTGAIAFGLLARAFFGTGVWDPINGYRGFQTESLRRLRLDAPGHDVEYQATIRASKLGMSILEIPSRELPRLAGWRKETAGTLRLGWVTLRCLGRELLLGRRFAEDG